MPLMEVVLSLVVTSSYRSNNSFDTVSLPQLHPIKQFIGFFWYVLWFPCLQLDNMIGTAKSFLLQQFRETVEIKYLSFSRLVVLLLTRGQYVPGSSCIICVTYFTSLVFIIANCTQIYILFRFRLNVKVNEKISRIW